MPPSELATLVDAEQQLDVALAEARARAAAVREEARRRAETAATLVDEQIASERSRIASEITAATAARARELAAQVQRDVARFEAVRGELLATIAGAVAAKLAAAVLAEAER